MPATLRARPWAPFPDGPAPFPGGRRRVGHRSGGAPVRTGPAAPPQTRWGGRTRVGQAPTRKRTNPVSSPPTALVPTVSTVSTTSMRLLVHTLNDDTACPALDGAA